MPNLFLSTLDYQFFKTKLFSRKDKHNWLLYKKQLSIDAPPPVSLYGNVSN